MQKITVLSLSKIWIVTDSHELEEFCRFRVDESETQHQNPEIKTENIPEDKQAHGNRGTAASLRLWQVQE